MFQLLINIVSDNQILGINEDNCCRAWGYFHQFVSEIDEHQGHKVKDGRKNIVEKKV